MDRTSRGLVFVADDETAIQELFKHKLTEWGLECTGVSDRAALMAALEAQRPCLLVLDLYFGNSNGIDLLSDVLAKQPGLMIILLTGNATIADAVAAVKQGAHDFLTKPPDWLRLEMIVNHSLRQHELHQRIRSLEDSMQSAAADRGLLGISPAMRGVRDLIATVGPLDVPVLVLGESGTGKELVARALHEASPHRDKPFVAVNMAALPKTLAESALFGHEKGAFTDADRARSGCFEQAENGTLFLDEIGDMDLELQAKLLRVLQERTYQRIGSERSGPVQCRVISATNRNLLERVRNGQFREDLYYRLNVVPIPIAPLRDRPEDIPVLANAFLRRASLRYHKRFPGFSTAAFEQLSRHAWPGNVRELENLVERLVILSPAEREIGASALPIEWTEHGNGAAPTIAAPSEENELGGFELVERQAIAEAMRKAKGNVRVAAALLGLGQATVYRKIKRYKIDPAAERVTS